MLTSMYISLAMCTCSPSPHPNSHTHTKDDTLEAQIRHPSLRQLHLLNLWCNFLVLTELKNAINQTAIYNAPRRKFIRTRLDPSHKSTQRQVFHLSAIMQYLDCGRQWLWVTHRFVRDQQTWEKVTCNFFNIMIVPNTHIYILKCNLKSNWRLPIPPSPLHQMHVESNNSIQFNEMLVRLSKNPLLMERGARSRWFHLFFFYNFKRNTIQQSCPLWAMTVRRDRKEAFEILSSFSVLHMAISITYRVCTTEFNTMNTHKVFLKVCH